jgi:hypothetical protein
LLLSCPTLADGLSVFVAGYSPTGTQLWRKRFDGQGTDAVRGITSDGSSLALTGTFQYGLAVNNVNLTTSIAYSGWIAKLDGAGNTTWAFSIAAPNGFQFPITIHATPSAILVGGAFNTAMTLSGVQTSPNQAGFLTSIAPNGTVQWVQTYEEAFPNDITSDTTGSLIVAGELEGMQSFGGGTLVVGNQPTDPFLVKLTASGGHTWSKSYPGADAEGNHVATTASDEILLGGEYSGVIDFGAGALPSDAGVDAFIVQVQP